MPFSKLEGKKTRDSTTLYASERNTRGHARRIWLRGMLEDGGPMGPSAPLSDLWTCWLLRFLKE